MQYCRAANLSRIGMERIERGWDAMRKVAGDSSATHGDGVCSAIQNEWMREKKPHDWTQHEEPGPEARNYYRRKEGNESTQPCLGT